MQFAVCGAFLSVLCLATETHGQSETPTDRADVVMTDEGWRVHKTCIVIDGHNDLPYQVRKDGESSFDNIDIAQPQPDLHTDIPRLRQGGLGAQFWSAYVPPSTIQDGGGARYTLEQIDLIHRMIARYPDTFELAVTVDDVERIHADGKIASMIGMEGGHGIEESLGTLRKFYDLGVRYMTLTHADSLSWCDSATDEPITGGLSPFGEEVVLEMNRLGMLVDISHISADAMRHVMRITKAPVIASHSGSYTIAEHDRNVPDDVLESVRDNGGVVMVVFFSGYAEPEAARVMAKLFDVDRELKAKYPDEEDFKKAKDVWRAANPYPSGTIHDVIDHIDHIVKVAGIDHVGLGSDFDGVSRLPSQLQDVTCYPFITQALLNRGYDEDAVRKIMGGNLLRAMRGAEQVAASWQD